MRDRPAIVLTVAAAALHLAVANRYDLFRDELYFIVCGHHPDFGYVDQPPLVPFLAAAGYALGGHAWTVRLSAAAAAAALVWLTVAFVRLLGGRDDAAWFAGLAVLVSPVQAGITATLNTTSFEPLTWTLVAYALTRAALLDDRGALVWGGAVAGVALEAKYGIALWLVALAAGVVVAGPRTLLRRRELAVGIALTVVIALPSVVWQSLHGWPFLELLRNANEKNEPVGPVAFALGQLVVVGPLLAPLWAAGLIAPFRMHQLRATRPLIVAFAVTAACTLLGEGKDYYLAPAYPPLFAAGAIGLAAALRVTIARAVYAGLALTTVALLPLALPILDPPVLIAYERTMHLGLPAQERNDEGAALPPTFADMLGWHQFVRQIADAWTAIPPELRTRTSILVDNYGQAAAIDLYGPAYGLPPALSGHNQYGIWKLRGQSPEDLLRVQRDVAKLRPYCASVRVLGTTSARYARAFENGNAIAFCRELHPTLDRLWPQLRRII